MEEKYVELFKEICENYEGDLGKKVTQKLFYFFERDGIELNLRYSIHYFGPYSSRLSYEMDILENDGFISIDESKSTHIISWVSNDKNKINALSNEEKRIAEDVLNKLKGKSASDLEALSTLDFVSRHSDNKNLSSKQIIDRFMEIKGKKYSLKEAERYYKELKDYNFA